MLITTYAGIVVNSDHVAYLTYRRHQEEPDAPSEAESKEKRFKLLLYLSNGDSVVAAVRLPEEEARSLRQTLTGRWAAGDRLVDVNVLLERPTADAAPYDDPSDADASAQGRQASVSE